MTYTITTPTREAAYRAEMKRRASTPWQVRVRDIAIRAFFVLLFVALILAASYGDTLTGINS